MTSANAVNASSSVAYERCASGSARPQSTSLLPPPANATSRDVSDAISQLLLVSSQMSDQQMQSGKNDALSAADRREAAAKQRKEALHRAADAARKAREAAEEGGVFSFITDNIGLTGLAGLVTCNFAVVAADVAAHKAKLTDGSAGLLDVGTALAGGPLAYLAQRGVATLAPDIGSSGFVATALAGPVGFAIDRAMKEMVPADFQKNLSEISSVKDNDLRVANKIALMVAMASVAGTATVLSGGTTAPAMIALAGIATSTATQIAAETGALKAVFGEELAGKVAIGGMITGAALSMTGAVWSIGASLASGAASASTATGGVAASGGAQAAKVGEHANTLKQVGTAINAGTTMLESADGILTGINTLRAANYQRTADHANTDAQEARNVMQRIEKLVDQIIGDLQTAQDNAQRATDTLAGTLQTHQKTMLQAGSMKV